MKKAHYLKILVEDIHSATVATLDNEGRPVTRIIDMMLYDSNGPYFLTAKGKEFYRQLMEQQYISLSATNGKQAISLTGRIKNIGKEKLIDIFDRNAYMQGIYPEGTRDVLEVFQIYEAKGEFFDISIPQKIVRDTFAVGEFHQDVQGYYIAADCIGCGKCYAACPQKCINTKNTPAVIEQIHCLHCGRCVSFCPVGAIQKRVDIYRFKGESS